MHYAQAKQGRIFLLRIDHKEDIHKAIRSLCIKEKIKAGVIHLVGSVDKATIVSGPKFSEVPPTPNFKTLKEAREMMGTGTILQHKGKPFIHLHGSFGRDEQAVVGCIRENTKTYISMEAVIIELTGIRGLRVFKKELGTFIPDF